MTESSLPATIAHKQPTEQEVAETRAAYNAVVRDANLQAIQLLGISFKVEAAFFGDRSKRRPDLKIEHREEAFNEVTGEAFSFVNMTVSVKSGRKGTLFCKAEYVVVYDNLIGANAEAVTRFLDRVAPFACYPYFRSVFATLDGAAGTRLPPLPIHKEKSRVESAGSPF